MNLLLNEGKSPVNATDMDGSSALHHAISEGHGEAALVLLRAGAETDKRDGNDKLAIDLAPDAKVNSRKCKKKITHFPVRRILTQHDLQVRNYILQAIEREGIEL